MFLGVIYFVFQSCIGCEFFGTRCNFACGLMVENLVCLDKLCCIIWLTGGKSCAIIVLR